MKSGGSRSVTAASAPLLPPGVAAREFSTALRRFEQVVGAEWMYVSADDVRLYRDAYSPLQGEPEERQASAAVAPADVEQVRAVVRIANELRIPLYTVSTGRNLGYGGSAPVMSGCVVLDLRRMNRILEVDERHACALVEPGVSYFDLYRHLRERRSRLWIDCPDPGWGSLIGNALERGAGFTPYRDHYDAHCGMEVVLANGDLLRTGMGALPGSPSWQQFKYGMGPYVDGLFSQSNLGIVTKMGFWLMPEPEAFRSATVAVPRRDDIVPLIDGLAALTYSGTLTAQTRIVSPVFHGHDPAVARVMAEARDRGSGVYDDYAQSNGLSFWVARLTFYGLQKVIDAQWEHVQQRFAGIPGVQFGEDLSYRFPLSDAQADAVVEKRLLGIPSLAVFAGVPGAGHIGFSPILPMSGAAVLEAMEAFGQVFAEAGIAPSMGLPESYHLRSLVMIFGFAISTDPAENHRTRAVYRRLIEVAAAHGWGEYRTHAIMYDPAMAAYSFNDHALSRLHATLKDALDPNGILSPGRYAMWPKRYRRGP